MDPIAKRNGIAATAGLGRGIVWYWLPAFGYAGLIFYLSSLPHPEDVLPSVLEQVGDKVLHAWEFGVLGILCYRALRYAAGAWAGRYALALAILAAVLYGLTDELHQVFVPSREADAWDLVADGTGAILLTWGWHRFARAGTLTKTW